MALSHGRLAAVCAVAASPRLEARNVASRWSTRSLSTEAGSPAAEDEDKAEAEAATATETDDTKGDEGTGSDDSGEGSGGAEDASEDVAAEAEADTVVQDGNDDGGDAAVGDTSAPAEAGDGRKGEDGQAVGGGSDAGDGAKGGNAGRSGRGKKKRGRRESRVPQRAVLMSVPYAASRADVEHFLASVGVVAERVFPRLRKDASLGRAWMVHASSAKDVHRLQTRVQTGSSMIGGTGVRYGGSSEAVFNLAKAYYDDLVGEDGGQTVRVGNVPTSMKPTDVKALFDRFTLKSPQVKIVAPGTFVLRFATEEDALRAVREKDGFFVGDESLDLSIIP